MERLQDKMKASAEEKLRLFCYYLDKVKKKSTNIGYVPNVEHLLKVFKDAMHDYNGT